MMRSLAWVAVLALCAPAAFGQASSFNFKLTHFAFGAAAGGASSVATPAWSGTGQVNSGEMLSIGFRANVGLLGRATPLPALKLPTIFGIEPPYGPKAGGTVITVNGMNFDVEGSSVFDTLSIGGLPVSSLTVLSNTELVATVPAGVGVNGGAGPQLVELGARFGLVQLPQGFVNTPAITTSPEALLGATTRVTNYGPTTAAFRTFISTAATSANTKYGKLLIGPFPLFELLYLQVYPGPDGVQRLELPVPDDPILSGVTVHFQTLTVTGLGPLVGALSNSSTTTFP